MSPIGAQVPAAPEELPEPLAIRLENISKAYSVSRRLPGGWSTGALGDDMDVDDVDDVDVDDDLETVSTRERREKPGAPPSRPRRVWALRDVSFTVEKGTVLGIVGENGSGKSTLVRILGRTLPPTSGRVLMRGRVVPALDALSSFFEGEQTAEANVRLLGEMLIAPRELVDDRIGEIFRFAELQGSEKIEMYRLSAGARPRLALSTALSLEPGVLLTEGLPGAGSDPEFRRRVLDRIVAMTREGLTVVIAAADAKMASLCQVALRLQDGRVAEMGPSGPIFERHQVSILEERATASEQSEPPEIAAVRRRRAEKARRGSEKRARLLDKARRSEQVRATTGEQGNQPERRRGAPSTEDRRGKKRGVRAASKRRRQDARKKAEFEYARALATPGEVRDDGEVIRVALEAVLVAPRPRMRISLGVAVERPESGWREIGNREEFELPRPGRYEGVVVLDASGLGAGKHQCQFVAEIGRPGHTRTITSEVVEIVVPDAVEARDGDHHASSPPEWGLEWAGPMLDADQPDDEA